MSVTTYVPDSSKIIHETQVDFKTRSIAKPVILVQYDKSLPIVAVKLYLGGEVFILPVGADVKIRWGKRDRTFVYKDVLGCNAARNTLYFDVDEQMSFYPGDLNPILELSISGNVAGSSPIPVTIDKNPFQEDDIQSQSEYADLTQAVDDAQNAADSALESKLDAETAKLAAEAAEAQALIIKNETQAIKEGTQEIVDDIQDRTDDLEVRMDKAEITLETFEYNNQDGIEETGFRYANGIDEERTAELKVEGRKVYRSMFNYGDMSKAENVAQWTASQPAVASVSYENGRMKYEVTEYNSAAEIRLESNKFNYQAISDKVYIRMAYELTGTSRYVPAVHGASNFLTENLIFGSNSKKVAGKYINSGIKQRTDIEQRFAIKPFISDIGSEDGKIMYIYNVVIFNISELIADKLYSPMYDKTFDQMTDEEIRLQMDDWVSSASGYLAGGGWTDFKTNVPASLLGKQDVVTTVPYKYHNNDDPIVLISPKLDGSFKIWSYKASGNKQVYLIPTHKYLSMFRHNIVSPLPIGLYLYMYNVATDTGAYIYQNGYSSVANGKNTNSFIFSPDVENMFVVSRYVGSATDGTAPANITIDGMILLDLTALGDHDLTVTQAYAKYGPMFDHLAKGPNMFPTNVEVIEGSNNLVNPNISGKPYLEDGFYRLVDRVSEGQHSTIDYNPTNGHFRLNKPAISFPDAAYMSLSVPEAGEYAIEFIPVSGTSVLGRPLFYPTNDSSTQFGYNPSVSEYKRIWQLPISGITINGGNSSINTSNNFEFKIMISKGNIHYTHDVLKDPISLGTFNPPANEFQELTYTPRNGASLFFNNLEDGDSQPKYAVSKADLTSTSLKYVDNDITDDWASIVAKTNELVNENQDQEERIETLEDIVFSDQYNTQVGVTNKDFKYYNLAGLKKDSNIKLHGKGMNIRNMMKVPNVGTHHGVTISYDAATGWITLNGTYTNAGATNYTLATNLPIDASPGEWLMFMRYYDSGTVDLKGSYIGYVLQGSSVSHRINENSEALYDPYISQVSPMVAPNAGFGQQVLLQFWKQGMIFNNFRIRIAVYKGTALQGYSLPSALGITSEVEIFNKTINKLDPAKVSVPGSAARGLTYTYDSSTQTFTINGTVTSTGTTAITTNIPTLDGQRLSITKYYLSGEATIGGTVANINIQGSTTVASNQITDANYWETSHATGTKVGDGNITIQLAVVTGQIFENYTIKLMLSEESVPINEYVEYMRVHAGFLSLNGTETLHNNFAEFPSIPYGVLEIEAIGDQLNLEYGFSISDISRTTLEYNSEVFSSNLDTSILTERMTNVDTPFRNKIIAIWGDSRESNNPTSVPGGAGDQLDTSWPKLLADKLGAQVLNFGLSGGSWAENTVQADAAAAIVNRVSTQDPQASADIIIISSFNDFKLYTPLGSSDPSNKTKTNYYGAMRTTYETLFTKYPGKRIFVVLPQKRYDEGVTYNGGASYKHYVEAQIDVANEYSIPIIDLYDIMPGKKGTAAYNTYMLNDTHWNATGNDRVAELVARHLIGGGNSANRKELPPLPTANGTYTLQVVITNGIPTFRWI